MITLPTTPEVLACFVLFTLISAVAIHAFDLSNECGFLGAIADFFCIATMQLVRSFR